MFWLLVSDWGIAAIAPDSVTPLQWQSLKSWVLLVASCGVLYWLLRRFESKSLQDFAAGISHDSTAHPQAEQSHWENEQFLRHIVDSATENIWVVEQLEDGEFCIISMNRAIELVTDAPAEHWIGKRLDELWDSQTTVRIRAHYADCLQQGKVTYEEELPFNDHNRTFLTSLFSLPNQQGRTRLLGISMDITEQKQAEAALRQSKATTLALLNAIPDMMFRMNREGVFLDFKPAKDFNSLVPPERFIGKTISEVLSSDIAQPTLQKIEQALTSGKVQTHEYQVFQENTLHSYEARIVTCSEHEVLAIVRDVSDRKRAEQEIQALNKTLEQQNLELETLVEQRTAELLTLINTLPDYIFVIDRKEMRFLFCNDQNAQFIGFANRQKVEGKTIFECFPPNLAADFAEQNQQVFESGEISHLQTSHMTPQGTLNLDTYKIPLKQPNGEVYALIGAARDVTELVKTRQQIADRTVQLEAANRELESFSYSVSHDLRAPLRHINGFVAALNNQLQQNGHLTDPKVCHYLQIIQESSQKMGQLVDALLSLSRVGRRRIADVPVNLNQLVEASLAQLSDSIAPDSSSEIVTNRQLAHFTIGDLPTVMGDATLLLQVFVNLLDNALKFSRDRRPAQIEIGTLPDDTIFVRDNGVGFQMEYADQLFGAFQRLHSQSEFEGTGIGLAIVQRIIHRHGGIIWAESQPNQGTTFFFKIGNSPEEVEHFLTNDS